MQKLQKIPAEVNRLAQQTELTLSVFFTFQFKVRKADEPKNCPKQGLGRLKQITESSPDETGGVSGLVSAELTFFLF